MTAASSTHAALDRSAFLRRVLLVDCATCLAAGALQSAATGPLASLLALPASLVLGSGLALFPVAAFMLWVATRAEIPRAGAWLVIVGNAGWVAACAVVLLLGSPSAAGYAFVIAQAVVAALLAELEYAGLKRIRG